MLQVAAQCLLVEDVYGVRPPYALLVLNGVQERVPFTPALEGRLLETMARMRDLVATDARPGGRAWSRQSAAHVAFGRVVANSCRPVVISVAR